MMYMLITATVHVRVYVKCTVGTCTSYIIYMYTCRVLVLFETLVFFCVHVWNDGTSVLIGLYMYMYLAHGSSVKL